VGEDQDKDEDEDDEVEWPELPDKSMFIWKEIKEDEGYGREVSLLASESPPKDDDGDRRAPWPDEEAKVRQLLSACTVCSRNRTGQEAQASPMVASCLSCDTRTCVLRGVILDGQTA
jgi:hypothetical protein